MLPGAGDWDCQPLTPRTKARERGEREESQRERESAFYSLVIAANPDRETTFSSAVSTNNPEAIHVLTAYFFLLPRWGSSSFHDLLPASLRVILVNPSFPNTRGLELQVASGRGLRMYRTTAHLQPLLAWKKRTCIELRKCSPRTQTEFLAFALSTGPATPSGQPRRSRVTCGRLQAAPPLRCDSEATGGL